MSGRADTVRGLSADELAAATAELQPLCGAHVVDVTPITAAPATADLLVILQQDSGKKETGKKQFLHIALGGTRARVCTTAQRFPKDDFGRGATTDLLQQHLRDAVLRTITHTEGERRCEFTFTTAAGDRTLAVELFSARGFWAMLDPDGTVLAMSRIVETAVRTLRLGDHYVPPPPAPAMAAPTVSEAPVRFPAPVLSAIDAFFTANDTATAATSEYDTLVRAAERAQKRAQTKADGLRRQLAAADSADELRTRADLMLAYAHTTKRGAKTMTVFDPVSGDPVVFDLDPARPVTVQAKALYEKARRLTDGRTITIARLGETETLATALDRVVLDLTAISPTAFDCAARLLPCREELQALGAMPAVPKSKQKPKQKPKPGSREAAQAGENYRRFTSLEGYQILVGRNNQQNDRLTMRTANGNDLWLHVGGGRPGSHVVIRLPKLKTASLETLLDAGTLAVHFSKARGERRIEVIYTQRKYVKKPKGLPPGAVVPSQTKTISVELDAARLKRLLDSAPPEES